MADKIRNIGKILEVKDGLLIADGLSDVGFNEIVKINTSAGGVPGLVMNIEEKTVGIVVLGSCDGVFEGTEVETTGELLSVMAGEELVGKVVDAMGSSLEGEKLDMGKGKRMPLEKVAPGVIERKNVDRPLQTGILAIDSMIPIGKGQRELIIGDRQTGKTAICIDTIINQKNENVICIYVSIGQKESKTARIRAKLKESGAMDYTIIVAAGAAAPAALQYIAPYTGCAIAEYFINQGKDVLIVYDDLTKHAWAYRELSLLLRRPPGREAYPGDVFYLHSRLLERAAQLSDEKGAGSITALPVVETQAGDISAYIPTNIISITDGQIYLEADLFNAGQRPALNIGLSVSRVGGSAQIKTMKQVAGQLKLDLAQYRELKAFAQFGAELDEATQKKIARGERMSELLKQNQYDLMSVGEQVLIVYAGINGHIDDLDVGEITEWKKIIREYIKTSGQELVKELVSSSKIEEKLEEKLNAFISNFVFKENGKS